MKDLFPSSSIGHHVASRIVKTYDYVDGSGALLYQAVRLEAKSFFQRRPDGRGGWIHNLTGVRRVLYRLPDLVEQPRVIWCEGEQDADNLAAIGFIATTACGASAGGATSMRSSSRSSEPDNSFSLPITTRPASSAPPRSRAPAAGFEVRALQLPGQGPVLEKVRASLSLYQLLRAAGATMWEAAQLTLAGPAPVVGESGLSCDVKNDVVLLPTLVPQSISVGAVNGVGQDCVLYSEHGLLVYVGALTGVSTVDAKVQESSVVGSGYGDIPGASVGQIVAANQVAIINFKRSLRFTRAVVTAGGTAALVAAAIFGNKKSY
jgi:hypothetical protein